MFSNVQMLNLYHFLLQPQLFDILEEISLVAPQEDDKNTLKRASSEAKCETRSADSAQVVGASATELESLKELIKFDHIYYKAESSVEPERECKKEKMVVISLPDTVMKGGERNASILPNNELNNKVDHEVDLMKFMDPDMVQSLSQLLDIDQLIGLEEPNQADASDKSADINKTPTVIPTPTPTVPVISVPVVSKDTQIKDTTTSVVTQRGSRKRKASASSTVTLEDFLAPLESETLVVPGEGMMNVTSPVSLSDSGYSSDSMNVMSPESDVSCVLDDDMWEESFTELFPSLL